MLLLDPLPDLELLRPDAPIALIDLMGRMLQKDLTQRIGSIRLVGAEIEAILLVAAWVEMLNPQEIADEIGKSLDFLESEMRDLPERHRSIRAVFDYSWNLLNDAERQAFMNLSIFIGGLTREAAQKAAGASLRVLTSLVNASLIHRSPNSGRYDIHELLRQYAEEWLKGDGNYKAICADYATYYLNLMAGYEPDLQGKRQLGALDDIAFAYTIAEDAENHRQYAESILALRRKIGDVVRTADVIMNLATVTILGGNFRDILTYYGEAEEIYRLTNNRAGLSHAYGLLAYAHYQLGDKELAYEKAQKGYDLALDVRDVEGQIYGANVLAIWHKAKSAKKL